MDDILDFGRIILVVAGALSIAILVRVVASRIGLPTAALLLIVAAVASELSDRLAGLLTFEDVQRVATLALIAILFDGGTSIGLSRFRTAAVPITILGVLGTFATAPLVAVAAHYLLGFDWTVSLLIGAALAPTDPAVTFSVLAGKEVEGPLRHDPRGRVGVQRPGRDRADDRDDRARRPCPSAGIADVAWEFLREMGIGLAVGAVAGVVMLQALRRVPLPDGSLVPAGGDARRRGRLRPRGRLARLGLPRRLRRRNRDRRRRAPGTGSRCATSSRRSPNLGELAVFVALGLTVDLGYILSGSLWWEGLVLAVILGFVVRPLVITPLLLPVAPVPRRAALRHLGRAQGRRADPARLARRRRPHGAGRTRSTGSSSWWCCSRSSSRARSCRASPSGSACR